MKQNWLRAALAVVAVLAYSAAPAPAQNPGGYYGGRSSSYPPSQQGYNQGYGQWQGYSNPNQYASYSGQGQGYYGQGQGSYGPGGQWQGGQWQGWNQPGQWGTNQYGQYGQYGQSGQWQGWNQPGQWGTGYAGQYPDAYHYGRGYHDGYHHGFSHAGRNYASTGPMGPPQDGFGPRQGGDFQFARIRGELQQTKQVQIPGLEEPLLVGMLTADQGQRIMVAFGPAKGAENLKLKSGQEITVTGQICEMCNRPMMLAEQVRSQGKTVPVQAFQDIEPQREQVRGKLTKVHKIQFPGMREAVMIGMVKTNQGQDTIVNLGSTEQAGELDLEEGTQVTIHGTGFEINGHQVLFADRIRANGQTLTLHE